MENAHEAEEKYVVSRARARIDSCNICRGKMDGPPRTFSHRARVLPIATDLDPTCAKSAREYIHINRPVSLLNPFVTSGLHIPYLQFCSPDFTGTPVIFPSDLIYSVMKYIAKTIKSKGKLEKILFCVCRNNETVITVTQKMKVNSVTKNVNGAA